MTEEERKLWYSFLCTLPVRFRRQKIIFNYIVDFYCPAKKLAIELDGSQHYSQESKEADKIRDSVLAEAGIKVLRFTNTDINSRFKDCCEEIYRLLNL